MSACFLEFNKSFLETGASVAELENVAANQRPVLPILLKDELDGWH